MTAAIEATGLTRRFGETRAVDGLSLDVPPGIVFGMLGPNGAGKTTTIRILATLLRPDGGTARVFGHDVVRDAEAVRARIALTGQFASVDAELTAYENLALLARLHGYRRADAKARARELLETFDLAAAGRRQVATFSGGMRRRLDIAASLIVRPDLLFLDEPTTGLDPRSRQQTWEMVRSVVAAGTTVVLTTQYLDEADQLADQIAVIDEGRLIAQGTSSELKASIGVGILQIRLDDPGRRTDAERVLVHELHAPVQAGPEPSRLLIRIPTENGGDQLAGRATHALAELSNQGIGVSQFALGQPTLDEAFLTMTRRASEESASLAEVTT